MIVQKIGSSYLFVFPAEQGRIQATGNPAGKITIGPNITVIYALKIIRGGRARFIGVDESQLPEDVKMILKTAEAGKLFGFMVRDAKQPTLDIQINPSFMANLASKARTADVQEKMSREGNLNITLAPSDSGVRIVGVILD